MRNGVQYLSLCPCAFWHWRCNGQRSTLPFLPIPLQPLPNNEGGGAGRRQLKMESPLQCRQGEPSGPRGALSPCQRLLCTHPEGRLAVTECGAVHRELTLRIQSFVPAALWAPGQGKQRGSLSPPLPPFTCSGLAGNHPPSLCLGCQTRKGLEWSPAPFFGGAFVAGWFPFGTRSAPPGCSEHPRLSTRYLRVSAYWIFFVCGGAK